LLFDQHIFALFFSTLAENTPLTGHYTSCGPLTAIKRFFRYPEQGLIQSGSQSVYNQRLFFRKCMANTCL
jgi:hypothetical protein